MTLSLAWSLSAILAAFSAVFRAVENLIRALRYDASGPQSHYKRGLAILAIMIAPLAALSTIGSLPGQGGLWFILTIVGWLESQFADGLENGGSDTMTFWHRFGFVALGCGAWAGVDLSLSVAQVLCAWVLASYLCAGLAKLRYRGWRNGEYLTAYLKYAPRAEGQRLHRLPPHWMIALSWAVMLWECAGAILWLGPEFLGPWMLAAGLFHLANSWLFGLQRFMWAWLATYPLLWAVLGAGG